MKRFVSGMLDDLLVLAGCALVLWALATIHWRAAVIPAGLGLIVLGARR